MLVVGFMTLWPEHIDSAETGGDFSAWLEAAQAAGQVPGWVSYELVEWSSNVVMFMPGGFLLCLLLPQRLRFWVPVGGMCTSVGIEIIQLFLPARTSSLLDILANSLGALLGWGVGLLVLRVRKTSSDRA